MKYLHSIFCIVISTLFGFVGCMGLDEGSLLNDDACVTVIEVSAGTTQPSEDSKVNISGSESGTRRVFWSEGDCLSLDGTPSEPLAAEYAGTPNATFKWNIQPGEGKLLYPASYWKDASTITLPYSQDKMPGEDNLANGTLPMCGVVGSGAVSLKNLCSILRIQWVQKTVSSDSLQVCYIEFKGKNDEQVSGDFNIDYSAATLSGASSAPESRYVRAYSMKAVGADTTVCNIVIPAGIYSNGFCVRVVDKRGYYMDAYTVKPKTLAAGTIVSMPCFKYNPSAKLNALSPATASELIAIAKEWNAGRYEGGLANICLASDIEFSEAQSAAWEELGGLGTDSVPYNGTFDGKDFSIKGLESSTPFFGNVGGEGTVQNVKIDSSCTFNCSPLVGSLCGKMNGCVNYADVQIETDLSDTVILGGLACKVFDGASITECSNYADLTVNSSNIKNTAPSYLGGIVGCSTGKLDINNCTNEGFIHCEYNSSVKVNSRSNFIGGIVGKADGGGTTINSCTNTGAIYNTNWNNAGDLRGPLSGGIVGAALGSESDPVEISSCKVLGPELMQTRRGIQGGIVGYASCATISACYFSKNTSGVTSNIPSNLGGICGKAVSTTISSCNVEDALLCCKTTMIGPVGGICGFLDSSSKVLDNNALRIKIARNASDDFIFGGVAGSVESETAEISGNSFGGKSSADGGTSWTAFTESNVCSSTTFTVNTPNTLVDSPVDLSGVVTCGSDPLEGVVVTDGYQSVQTDINGRFHLTGYASKVRFVSVCLPEGYAAPAKNGLPVFFVNTGGENKEDITFNLTKIDNPDKFTVFFTGDPQQRPSGAGYDNFAYHSGVCASNVYEAVGTRAATITDRRCYGIVLGDVIHNNTSLYSNHRNDLAKYCSSMSTYHIIGNHDYNPSAKEIVAGMADFESNFGPVNYSMNIGKFHFVMLNNIQSKLDSSGQLKAYDQGLTDDQITWLKSDLQYVPTSTPLIVCAHSPMFAKGNASGSISYMENNVLNAKAYKTLFAQYSNVYVMAGHMHTNFTFIYSIQKPTETSLKGVQCFQLARCGGALWINEYLSSDGSPRGYLQMDFDGASASWKYICDVKQTSVWCGKYNGTAYSAPSYDEYRDWDYSSSGVPVLKTGGNVDENYQMKLYPDKDGYFWANIFFWDVLWETPVLTYTNTSGASVSVEMPRVAFSAGYDFSYDFYNKYYAEKNDNWKTSTGTSLSHNAHMFKCEMPTDCLSNNATVTVKDRFGNVYSSSVSW